MLDITPGWREHTYWPDSLKSEESPELLLFRANPVGINFDDNTDEYHYEAGLTISPLPNAIHAQVLNAPSTRYLFYAPIADYARGVARDKAIWNLWQHYQNTITASTVHVATE